MNGRAVAATLLVSASLARAVVEVPGPPARPSLARAEAVYRRACQSCHGAGGAPLPVGAPTGVRLPAFGNPDWLAEQTPAEVFAAVRAGHGGRLAPPPNELGLQESWDVATFVWSFGHPAAEVDEGRRLFAVHCADCHGAAGDGIGAAIEERPATSSDFSLVGTLAMDSDADLTVTLTDGLPEFGMPRFADTVSDRQRQALVSFLRALPFSEVYLASAAGRAASWRSPRLSLPPSNPPPPRADRGVSFTQWVARIVGTLVAVVLLLWALRGRTR